MPKPLAVTPEIKSLNKRKFKPLVPGVYFLKLNKISSIFSHVTKGLK